jgi:mono/diheme cytochrome c family protein
MSNTLKSLLIAVLFVVALGCQAGRHSSAGFRLPPDSDVERGKAVFVAFGCHACHNVDGVQLPKPPVTRQVSVLLGGTLDKTMTDGYLVTSIIYPSYQLAPYPRSEITSSGGESRMPHYAATMTVQQLVDIVAFLQSRYRVRFMRPDERPTGE